mmetsp:Transcript_14659/g.30738  ORF Transcript_14659/g.30738 Transcript_14659/m.30738 type:complete len:166 (-) Transcript_14659:2006-2503(-)
MSSYATGVKALHWGMGTGILACFGTVQAAMNTPKGGTNLGLKRPEWMMYHKSIAVLVMAMLPARLALRATSALPKAMPVSKIEKTMADASHYAMYGFITVLPVTGFAMGLFNGGKGIPFFGLYTIPGFEKNGAIAGNAFKVHKQVSVTSIPFQPHPRTRECVRTC